MPRTRLNSSNCTSRELSGSAAACTSSRAWLRSSAVRAARIKVIAQRHEVAHDVEELEPLERSHQPVVGAGALGLGLALLVLGGEHQHHRQRRVLLLRQPAQRVARQARQRRVHEQPVELAGQLEPRRLAVVGGDHVVPRLGEDLAGLLEKARIPIRDEQGGASHRGAQLTTPMRLTGRPGRHTLGS